MKLLGTILLWVVIAWIAVAMVLQVFRKLAAWMSGAASITDDAERTGRAFADRAVRRAQRQRRR